MPCHQNPLWDVPINPSVIAESQLPLAAKCNLNPVLDVAINPSVIVEGQLPLSAKCNLNPLLDVAINLSVIRGRSVTFGKLMLLQSFMGCRH